VKIAIDEIRALMTEACCLANVPGDRVGLVVEHYITGELRGKSTHGVAKFCYESRFFAEREASPEVVRESLALSLVDAHRELGPVSAEFAVQEALRKAHQFGAGIVGMINTQRYGMLAPWSEAIAEHGLIGIVMNTSRADSIVQGAKEPFLGVNPLSFAFPAGDEVICVDMATTIAPMGLLWESRRTAESLPRDAFVDDSGQFTRDPKEARSAVVFGGYKGFGISLLVQILTGSLFGFPMSVDVTSTWLTGYTFIAITPAFGAGASEFVASNSRLVDVMERVAGGEGGILRIPGRSGNDRMAAALAAGCIELSATTYDRLRARAMGIFDVE
jgi:L-2-hydroxycarboxylate dehydrogenase (NAD+)